MWGALIAAAALISIGFPAVSLADSASGCDFAPTGTTASCQAPLTGSTFEGGDGNLLVNTAGNTDWVTAPNRVVGIDQPSGGSDNAFGQGTKEDNPDVTVVDGSVPPNKSDLTRFYVGSEFASASNFLYLAWERSNALGNANMDFEINQASQVGNLCATCTGPITITRTAGDLLVTYDFTNGGGRPVLGLDRWLTSATTPSVTGFSTNVCASGSGFPCWGDHVTLNGTDSEGAVNNIGAVSDPIATDKALSQNPVPALQFGEAAINLTAAGVFPAGTCTAFGSVYLKSRSSSSFTSEVKDFVSPQPVNISNCGTVNIIKHTDPRGIDQNFSYTSTIPNPPAGATSPTTPDCTLDTTPSGFTLNDKNGTDPTAPITTGTANTEHCANVPAGSYTVTEGAEPANFVLESLTCTATGTGSSGSQNGTTPAQADITVAPGGVVTCTYTNQQQLGAITITKSGKDLNCTGVDTPSISNGACTGAGTANLSGAVFSIKDSGGNAVTGSPATTGADGTVCVGSLPFGTYSVQETTAPNGYAKPATTTQSVTVSANADCSGNGTPATATFSDTPLTNISAGASAVVKGTTNSTITCVGPDGTTVVASAGPGDPVTAKSTQALPPGTYTCTIEIDP